MQDDQFEWDDEKARVNWLKHRLEFSVARLVFADPGFFEILDETMDYGEERFKAMGMANGRLIVVFYTMREDRYRIISARRASRQEHDEYARENP